MDPKKKRKIEAKSLRQIASKKICTILDLAEALKISKTTLYSYGLNKNEKILALIASNKGITDKKECTKKIPKKLNENNPIRAYSEIKAKLDLFKIYRSKNYNKLSESAKRLLDRQIWLLEWVLKINKKETE